MAPDARPVRCQIARRSKTPPIPSARTGRGTRSAGRGTSKARSSHALILGVGPLLLHPVGSNLLLLPGANVADLAICIVVPPGSWHRVGDGFAELMGADRGEPVEERSRRR